MIEKLITLCSIGFQSSGQPSAQILGDVNFSIAAGERLALIGANGTGKTTLLRLIANDRSLKGLRSGVFSRSDLLVARPGAVGYVRQRPVLFPWLDVCGNIAFGRTMSASSLAPDPVALGEHIQSFGCAMLQHKYPSHLSGGEMQRVALAQALYPAPALLMLDEPFSAMDIPAKAAMTTLLTTLWSQRKFAMLFVGHDFRDVLQMADRILILGRQPQGATLIKELHVSAELRDSPSYIKEMLWTMSEATAH